MSLLQPTIRRFPKTAETLADSNLPFSCVVSPMKEPTGKDPKTQLPMKSSTSLAYCNYPLLSSIPKCMSCGAPHPTNETRFWPHPYSLSSSASPSSLVCYLCGGKTTNDKLPPPSASSGFSSDPHASVDRLLPQIYQIPLITTPETTFWSLPANTCPPVCWFLLDGSCTNRSYWTTISHLLLQVIDDIPPHVHIGILLAATVPSSASEDAATTFSYVDLTSPVPHIKQYVQYAGEDDDEEEPATQPDGTVNAAAIGSWNGLGGLLDEMTLVPANSLHLPNVHAAIRSLVDYDPSQLATTQRSYTMSMPLGKAIETILDFMDRAQHPGAAAKTGLLQNLQSTTTNGNSNYPLEGQMWYAGGKIMSFLASCPTDLRGDDWRPLTRKNLPRTTVGLGGFGGVVKRNAPSNSGENSFDPPGGLGAASNSIDEETGVTMSWDGASNAEILDTDMTPSSLLDYYRAPEHVEAYFQELGSQCAESALGVDIFVLVNHQEDADVYAGDYDDNAELDVGLPFLRALADRSGAPGPLIFPLHQGYSTPFSGNPNIQRLRREVSARVPWGAYDGQNEEENNKTDSPSISASRHVIMGFGGELRLRLSPSFEVDRAPVDEVDKGPQLATLYSSGGIMGPAAEEEENGNLWRFGTCDPFTTVAIDLDMKEKVARDRLKIDEMGEISWKPVLQTCFAYTTIVKDPEQPGEYLTVRQMRIACARATLTNDVEALYASIDPDVIGSVLFHKLTLTLLRDGLSMVQTIGEDWLKSLLVCAYQSAEVQEKVQREQAEHGITQDHEANGGDHNALTLYANERLLDREGELSAEDVLMAQGHELLKSIPLIVYSLLHCDAVRPSSSSKSKDSASGYFPTMDARCAAGAQMSSMNPPILAKCIAPRLQLWSCSEGLILDRIDLKMESISVAIEEFGNDGKTGKTREDMVLFLDAPDCIVVCDAGYFSDSLRSKKKKKKKTSFGPELEKAIEAATCSYRTPPTVLYDLDPADNSASQEGFLRLMAALVEDMPANDGATNFKQWCENLAAEIHE